MSLVDFHINEDLKQAADVYPSVRFVPELSDKLSCREALHKIAGYPEYDYFIVSDKKSRPLGYLEKDRFRLALSGRLGLELYYEKPVASLMGKSPILEREELYDHPANSLAIVTDQGKAYGIRIPVGNEKG